MKKILLFLLLLISPAFAQQTVITKPFVPTAGTTIGSSTITTTNTFQTVFGLNTGRSSCLIQNTSASNTMWVYFGARTSATKPLSLQLTPGAGVGCITGSVVLKDEIAITGTAGDTFYAGQQQ